MHIDVRLVATEQELTADPEVTSPLYSVNVSHYLGRMAYALGVGAKAALWYPPPGKIRAKTLAPVLTAALAKLQGEPARYKAYEMPGATYDGFILAIKGLLEACQRWPESFVLIR
jgi:hypothetical protein